MTLWKVSNRTRRAERAGLEIESGASERLISEFHQLLHRSFERWARHQNEPLALARWRGLRRDPQEKFVAIAASIGTVFRLFVARHSGEPAAAILILLDGEAHLTRGAMHEELGARTYANYLLHTMAIREACQAGCRHYHMGETGGSSSLAEFKQHFGATAKDYAEYRFERLPISRIDNNARKFIKRLIGFRDA
jgi:lipid II:glycine glycyltransferase (peptidoglycan interpeptide bridge formation enzyme)